jgi:hypothetical protein
VTRGGFRLAALRRAALPAALLATLLATLLVGCATGRNLADSLAREGGFRPVRFPTSDYVLAGFLKAGGGKALAVYLEGDGRAYLSRSSPSSDPTPSDPLALRLALTDPAPAVLYLARPCQFVEGGEARGCIPEAWTTGRLSPRVLEALNQALDQAKARTRAERLYLIGYSGGGGLAVLLAARRNDVDGVLTVAGLLDHAAWTAGHGVTPLAGSLNPVDAAPRVQSLPQTHFVGSRDEVVPESVARSYLARLEPGSPARVEVVAGADHRTPWAELWPGLLARFRPDWPPAPLRP